MDFFRVLVPMTKLVRFKWVGEISNGWVQAQCDGFSVLSGSVESVLQECIAMPSEPVLDVGI